MEQLLAYQQWDLCMGFIDAAAAEKLAQHLLGVYKDEGVTVQYAYDLGTTPLRPSEAPILKITPEGILEKCKWRTTIDGSSEKEGEHYHGSSHHAAPSQDSIRLWFAQEANVPTHERCGQADVSSAYNVAGVGNDAHGNPAKIFVRKTSWDHAVQIIRGEDGVTRAAIDWDWLKEHRDILLTLPQNTYGRKAGGRVWQNHLHGLLTAPPLSTVRTSTEAAWRHIRRKTTTIFPESARDGMPDGGGDIQVHTDDMLIRPKQCTSTRPRCSKSRRGSS
jgi:hypothetical protein